MTSYHVSIGYNSRAHDDAWGRLVNATRVLRIHPEAILAEVRRVEGVKWDGVAMYAEAYKSDEDLTIRVFDGEVQEIVQFASGGGVGREIKEAFRRAFCRLLIAEMHRQGIEVNLRVC